MTFDEFLVGVRDDARPVEQLMQDAWDAAVAAEQERIAAWFETGRWCRLSDHMQGACDCEDIAAAIRSGILGPKS